MKRIFALGCLLISYFGLNDVAAQTPVDYVNP